MKRLLAATAAVGLVTLAGCSTAPMTASSSASAPATTEVMTPTASPTSTSTSATMDIVDTAVAAGDFTTLATALTEAGLVETLKGPGPFTVFAPTDAAFEALPAGTLDALLADKEKLTEVLTYHVVPGEVLAEQVVTMNGKKVKTVEGDEITIEVNGGVVTLVDEKGNKVKVTTTDIMASNGVIHVIDGVLMPD